MKASIIRLGTLVALGAFLTSTGSIAQGQQTTGQQKSSGGQSELKVQSAVPSDSMFELRAAVRALREASVRLVDPGASKQAGPDRQKAFEAAQDAIYKVQRAMVQLPDAYKPGDKREAKDWPAIAARVDKASIAIEKAMADLEKQKDSKQVSGAMDSLRGALDDAEKALRAMPEWNAGERSS